MSTLLDIFNYQPEVLETIGRWKDYLWVDVGILKNSWAEFVFCW